MVLDVFAPDSILVLDVFAPDSIFSTNMSSYYEGLNMHQLSDHHTSCLSS